MSIENKVPMSDFTEVTDIADTARIIGLQDNENVKIPLQSLISKTLNRVDEDILTRQDINVENGVTGFEPIGQVAEGDMRAVSGNEVFNYLQNGFFENSLTNNYIKGQEVYNSDLINGDLLFEQFYAIGIDISSDIDYIFDSIDTSVFSKSNNVGFKLYNKLPLDIANPIYSGKCSFPNNFIDNSVFLDKKVKVKKGETTIIIFRDLDLQSTISTRCYTLSTKPDKLPQKRVYISSTNAVDASVFQGAATINQPFFRTYIRDLCIPYQDLILPKKIYSCVGFDSNIYFKKISQNINKLDIDVISNFGRHRKREWRYTPVETDGSFVLRFDFRNEKSQIIESKSISNILVPKAKNIGNTKKTLVMGDSWVASGDITKSLFENGNVDGCNISLIGTIGEENYKHEGRGGWTIADYMSNKTGNLFYNPTTKEFDLSYYITSNSFSNDLDVFICHLGINDVINLSTDEQVKNRVFEFISNVEKMRQNVLLLNSKIVFILALEGIQSDQNAYGINHSGLTANRGNRNMFLLNKYVLNYFDKKPTARFEVIPCSFNLDVDYNYPAIESQVNSRNIKKIEIHSNAYHPSVSGYQQVADSIFCFIKNI